MRHEKQKYLVPKVSAAEEGCGLCAHVYGAPKIFHCYQMAVINEYAAHHDLSIVHVYSDEGISGLHVS